MAGGWAGTGGFPNFFLITREVVCLTYELNVLWDWKLGRFQLE